ncbi:MAG: hypothetical protein JSV53_00275 [candidate division WOR-3 bacterium]|nr:MAG: hypothetical protein JSV53_00275 [candidate division WOR-3 bacterium]
MKRKLFVAAVLVMAVAISQCSKETDEDAIRNLIEADTIWFNPNSEVDSTTSDDRDTVAIWWRGVQTHDEPIIDIQITGDSAWVSFSRGNFGHFYSLAKIDTMPWVLWDKNLSETAQLRAIFMRTGEESDENRGWELDKISLAFGQSNTVNTVSIDSLRITTQTEAVDMLIVDPLNTYFDLESLVTFQAGEQVTLTLYTNVADGHAFLHTFILAWPFYIRLPFTNMGDGVFQGTWHAQLVAIPRFAIFDLMPHSTIYTQEGPYDFNGWLLPYMISE